MKEIKNSIELEIQIEELEPIIAPDNGELFCRFDDTPVVNSVERADGEQIRMAA